MHETTDPLKQYKAAVGGAAVGLATEEARSTGGKITVGMVNKYTRRLNKIAGFIIVCYLLFIAYVVFSNSGRVMPAEELVLNENRVHLIEVVAMCKGNLLDRAQCSEAKIAEMQINADAQR